MKSEFRAVKHPRDPYSWTIERRGIFGWKPVTHVSGGEQIAQEVLDAHLNPTILYPSSDTSGEKP